MLRNGRVVALVSFSELLAIKDAIIEFTIAILPIPIDTHKK